MVRPVSDKPVAPHVLRARAALLRQNARLAWKLAPKVLFTAADDLDELLERLMAAERQRDILAVEYAKLRTDFLIMLVQMAAALQSLAHGQDVAALESVIEHYHQYRDRLPTVGALLAIGASTASTAPAPNTAPDQEAS